MGLRRLVPTACLLLLPCVSLAGRNFVIYRLWSVDVPDDWETTATSQYPLDIFSAGPKSREKIPQPPVAVVNPNGREPLQASYPEARPGFSVGFSEVELAILLSPDASAPEPVEKMLGSHKIAGWRKSYSSKDGTLILCAFVFPRCALPGVRADDYSTVMLHVVGRTEAEIDDYFKVFAGLKSRAADDSAGGDAAHETKPPADGTDQKK